MILPSCDRCRQRKVKCDRAHRCCSNCSQADAECIYPSRKGRAPKRPRAVPHAQLIERLSRLENIIRQAGDPGKARKQSSDGAARDGIPGRLIINETNSYYVSNALWSNLAAEVEELRALVLDPISDDENDESASPLNAAGARPPGFQREGSNAAVFGFQAAAQSLQHFHPSIPQAMVLFTAFQENVIPLVHIFHMPSLIQAYWDALSSPGNMNKDTEALLCAIHYAAIVSMDQNRCTNALGTTRESALDKYRTAAEQALARADLLNTQSLKVLQAAAVFLTALRAQDESRTTWSLTSLVYHIAQAMGLHRDGEAFGLKPFETELRRRLWWHICVLDSRSSEYHGYEPIVQDFAFDTKSPLHINDVDLLPDMVEPPLEQWAETTDMTFTLVRCEAMKLGWKLRDKRTPNHPMAEGIEVWRETQLKELELLLQQKFLPICDNSSAAFHRLVSAPVARLIIARFGMLPHNTPRSPSEKTGTRRESIAKAASASSIEPDSNSVASRQDSPSQDRPFLAAIQNLEVSAGLLTDPRAMQWAWYSRTHINWAAVTLVLSELCTRPASADCDRAWRAVSIVYDAWKTGKINSRGAFSVPIQRLMAKARCTRETAQFEYSTKLDSYQPEQSFRNQTNSLFVMSPPCEPMVGLTLSQNQQAAPLEFAGMYPMPDTSWATNIHNVDFVSNGVGTESLDDFLRFVSRDSNTTKSGIFYNSTIIGDEETFSQNHLQAENFGQSYDWAAL